MSRVYLLDLNGPCSYLLAYVPSLWCHLGWKVYLLLLACLRGGAVCYLNPPGIDTEFALQCPVERVLIRGAKWGQRTVRGIMKTCRKLSLNSVWTRQMRAAGMSG